jgi:hypothetical protein
VSDPRAAKQERELNQVGEFLRRARVPYTCLERGGDPPDVVVHRNESSPLGIEVTEYHPQDGRVGVQTRWEQFREVLDPLLAARPLLAGVQISLTFHDHSVPKRSHHASLAREVVRCAEFVRQCGWEGTRHRSLYFLDTGGQHFDRIGPDEWIFSAADWPELAAHVNQLELRYYGVLYPLPISNYPVEGAWCSPSADALRASLDRKEAAVRAAIDQGRYAPGWPLWLLIVANNPNDISSFAFADEGLKEALDSSGFDFQASVFQEVWMSEGCGPKRVLRLHPWGGLGTAPVEG